MQSALFNILVFPGFIFLGVVSLFAEYFDRKLHARLQNRVGPPWFQPLADFIKLLGKEEIVPGEADKSMFKLAPIFALTASITAFFYIPMWGPQALASFHGDLIVVLDADFLSRRLVFALAFFLDRRRALDHPAVRLRDPALRQHPGAGALGRDLVAVGNGGLLSGPSVLLAV